MVESTFDWTQINVHKDYKSYFQDFIKHGINHIDASGYNALMIYLWCTNEISLSIVTKFI